MKEEWLFPNTFVPVDVETTSALIVEIKRLIDVVGGVALAQQEPDTGDELTIAYMSGVHRGKELAAQPVHVISEQEQLKQWIETTKYFTAKREYEPWCMKMNRCTTKCEDCPDEPVQEPVAWLDEEKKIIYWHNTHETDDYHGFKRSTPLYTTPQQHPWVGLTEAQFLEATRLAENGNYLVAFVRIQEWLKEQNT